MSTHPGGDVDSALVDLQSRLAYQEDTLQALDAVVTAQESRIARLETAVERLVRRLDELAGPGDGGDAAPPHY